MSRGREAVGTNLQGSERQNKQIYPMILCKQNHRLHKKLLLRAMSDVPPDPTDTHRSIEAAGETVHIAKERGVVKPLGNEFHCSELLPI